MVMPAAYNPISLGQIQTEFTGANPAFLSEYYRGGGYTTQNNTNVPTSGTIALSNFYSAYRQVISTGSMIHYFNNSDATITYEGVVIDAFTNVRLDGTGATFVEENSTPSGILPALPGDRSGSFDSAYRYYSVTWNIPFLNANYSLAVTLELPYIAAAVQVDPLNPPVDPSVYAIADITSTGFKVQFKNNGNGASTYVRSFSATAALV